MLGRVIEQVVTDRQADAVQRQGKAAAICIKRTFHIGTDSFGHQKEHHDHHTSKTTVRIGTQVVEVQQQQ